VTSINNVGYLRIALLNILPACRVYIQTIFCHSLIMISTTFYVASRVAITGLILVLFFKEMVLHPIQSGPKKVSTGLIVSAVKSTIILILAADKAASIYLSDDTSAPSTEGHIPDAVPAVPRLLGMVCPVCKLHQGIPDCYLPVNFILPVPAEKFFLSFYSSPSSSSLSPVFRSTMPSDITTTLDLPYFTNCKHLSHTLETTFVACDDDHLRDVLLSFQHHLLSPVPESMPCNITTTPDLPNLAICNQFSITSDTTLVASDNGSKDIFSDEVWSIISKLHIT
jgi:hypothetical protein